MKLEQSATFLMIPFYIKSSSEIPHNALWCRREMVIEKGFLYPHVQNVLQSSVLKKKETKKSDKPDDYLIYSIREDSDFNRLFGSETICTRAINSKPSFSFEFFMSHKKLLSPKLIICTDVNVGMLILPIHMKDISTDDLIAFNYAIQKANDKELTWLFLKEESDIAGFEASISKIVDEDKRNRQTGICQLRREALVRKEKDIDSFLHINRKEGEPFLFSIPQLVSSLLSCIKGCELVNDTRYHLFTYLQADNSESSETSQSMVDDFIRICRSLNKNYQVADDDRHEAVMQLFANIFVGSSVEGSAMMMISNDSSFQRDYLTDTFQDRYLWLYILAFMQRISLVIMHKELSLKGLCEEKTETMSLKELRSEVRRLINMRVNTFFTDVSDYSQHNQFYQFCKSRLGVDRLFDELNDKMKQIDLLLSQKSLQVREKNQMWLTIVIGILAVCSAANDATDQIAKICCLDDGSLCFTIMAWFVTALLLALFIPFARKIIKLFK